VPRIPRGQQAGYAYHIINRGGGRAPVFDKNHSFVRFFPKSYYWDILMCVYATGENAPELKFT
jgi:hypothetical protein